MGNQFDVPHGEVLGLVLSLKYNNDTISVWHRTAADPAIVAALKSTIEGALDMQEGMRLEHESFKEALAAPAKPRREYQHNGEDQGGQQWGRGRGNRGRGGYRGRGGRPGTSFRQDMDDFTLERPKGRGAAQAEGGAE